MASTATSPRAFNGAEDDAGFLGNKVWSVGEGSWLLVCRVLIDVLVLFFAGTYART